MRVAPLLLLGPWGHRRALTLDMGFDADEEASADGLEFVRFLKLVQRHFVAQTSPIPTFSDKSLSELTMLVFGLLSHAPHARVKIIPEAGQGLAGSTAEVVEFLLAAVSFSWDFVASSTLDLSPGVLHARRAVIRFFSMAV